MTALTVSTSKAKKKATKLTRNSSNFKTIIKAIQQKKGENIVSLDLRKIPEAVADFFIICEASSNVQIKAISDAIEIAVKQNCQERPFKHEGRVGAHWVLIDYVNVVVHIFYPDTRKFYRLEEMWADGGITEHNE
ncbi:MAG TPA: ribosome silencing factor [Chitinophagaceae bacterium]|nr:ribosome silencing factor [Chitinophagaceae bacterium]